MAEPPLPPGKCYRLVSQPDGTRAKVLSDIGPADIKPATPLPASELKRQLFMCATFDDVANTILDIVVGAGSSLVPYLDIAIFANNTTHFDQLMAIACRGSSLVHAFGGDYTITDPDSIRWVFPTTMRSKRHMVTLYRAAVNGSTRGFRADCIINVGVLEESPVFEKLILPACGARHVTVYQFTIKPNPVS